MAKTASKTATKAPKKAAAAAPKTSKAKTTKVMSIDKASEDALKKLKALDIEHQLQADLEWCLGSFGYDKNPSGLYQMMSRALTVFKSEQTKKTKGITAKFVSDLEKTLETR